MSTLNSISLVVCVCSICCSIISLIAPFGRMTKTINLIMGVFMISSMIIPMLSVFDSFKTNFEFSDNVYDNTAYTQQDYDELVLSKTADNLVQVSNEILLSENIAAENIEVGIKKTDSNRIYISTINIYITKEYEDRIADIKKIIFSNMSKEPVIIINE